MRDEPAGGRTTGEAGMTRARLDQLARIARAVLGRPEVQRLHPGPTGRIASATATGRVVGVLFQGNCLIVGVIAAPGTSAAEVTTGVRRAVTPMIPRPTPVTVVVTSGSAAGRGVAATAAATAG